MRYKLLGRSGLRVSELALGTMTFGEAWGFGENKDVCRKVWDLYVSKGGNFIDTANKYTEGQSEQMVGEFMEGDRERFVVATKYTLSTRTDDPNAHGNHRKNMVQALEASLRRLRTEYVDLFWMHAWDGTTPVDEVMRGLDDLVRAGKVLYVGVSDTPAWVVAQANTIADLRGWSRFIGLQVEYSLIERTVERELIPMALALGLGVLAWAPLGAGVLTGKYNAPASKLHRLDSKRAAVGGARVNAETIAVAVEVKKIADELGKTPAQVALNWLRQRHALVIPIVGARKAPQLADSLGALDFTIPDEQRARLDRVSQVSMGFPHDFLGQDFIRAAIHGDTYGLLDFRKH
ncbi:MAG: aldo/keto reductase [Deltaproteobacteria bacterium]|nr:aldo/keto reductase [Deltaproteobacteria bacterium]